MQRIRWGDQDALESIFRLYYDGLCRFMLRLTNSQDDVEDMVQEIFVRIWINKENWYPKGTLKSYLFKAARNQAINFSKREARDTVKAEDDNLFAADSSTDPVERMIDSDIVRTVDEAIERLPRRCRLIFTLNRQEGLSYSEIAEVLGISAKTVENQIAHALKVLRKELKSLK